MSPSDDVETPASPAPPRRAPAAGDVLSERYRLVQRIATGGSAEVFEAEHAVTKRRVAVKVLRTDARGELSSVDRFFREASACAGIDSDHIVAVLDCDVDKATDAPFIVMELLHGKDLARFVADTLAQGTPVPPSLAMNLLKQVASALDKVHARGIVHRDLKPANLFLSFPSDGPARVKVLDFGIARIAADGAASGGGRIGTPLYMSAEQLSGGAEVSPAADIWSFSLIAYELLVGYPYWEGNTAASLFARIPDGSARPKPTELAARHGVHLPRAFDPWLLRCIDPDPSRRPNTVGEALGDLLRLYDPKATQPPTRAAAPPARLAPRASPRPPAPSSSRPRVEIPLPGATPSPSPALVPAPASVLVPMPTPTPTPAPTPAPAPPLARPNPTEELDDEEIEDLTETSDLPQGMLDPPLDLLAGPPPGPSASEARTRQMAPVSRDDEDRRLTRPMAPVVADLFGPPLPSEAPPDERVTAELPAAHRPSSATPRERPLSPDPEPEAAADPFDTLGANVAAAMESPETAARARRIPRSVELASTALLPVQAPVAAAPGVKPMMLAAAAAVTLGLASAAGWVLFHDRGASSRPSPRDSVWRSPSAFESASLAATTATWTAALSALTAGPGRPSGADTARVLHALLEAHRAGVALPPERQVEQLIALDRLRTPRGWAASPDAPPDAESTAWATLAYASMAEITQADAARVRVQVARDALLALQQPDGSFDAGGDPLASPLRSTSLALDALLASESALRSVGPEAVSARRRAVGVLREALQRSDHPVWTSPPALDLAVAALWSARSQAHDAEASDATVASRYVDHLGERCPDQRCAALPPLADAPWIPGSLLTASRLLRDPSSLPSSSLRALSALMRSGIAAVDRDRAHAGDLRWQTASLVAVSQLQR